MLGYQAKHANPNPTPEELVYDPSAEIVIMTDKGLSAISAKDVVWLDNLRKSNNDAIINFTNRIESVKSYINENYDDLELHADEIAEILGIDLTRKVELEMSATFTLTVELERDQDPSDIDAYDFNVEISSYTYDIENDDVTAIHIDDYSEL